MKANEAWGVVVAVAGIWAGALAGCAGGQATPAAEAVERAVPVAVTVVERVEEAPPVRVPGRVRREAEVPLAFKIGGVLEAVEVRAGDRVTGGQVLARLRPGEIDAEVARAEAARAKAVRDLERVRVLEAERVATREQVQDAETAVALAAAAVEIATFNRRFAEVRAPADGVVLRRVAEPEELVAPGRPILTFAGEEAGWIVEAGLPEREVLRVAEGDPARVRGVDGRVIEGILGQVSGAADPGMGTVPVEVRLASVPGGWRSGFVVDLEIRPRRPDPASRVPLAALVAGDRGRADVFILAVDGASVERMTVEVEAVTPEGAWLADLLPEGTRVVTAGAEYLRAGSRVRVVER